MKSVVKHFFNHISDSIDLI